MNALERQPIPTPGFPGYLDCDGRFVPFPLVDEVFDRARRLRTRILLRLVLNEDGELQGTLYTTAQSFDR
ncbi:MAG: hypothetical protein AB7Q97_09235 [Gammaproteobacteria bacterium]